MEYDEFFNWIFSKVRKRLFHTFRARISSAPSKCSSMKTLCLLLELITSWLLKHIRVIRALSFTPTFHAAYFVDRDRRRHGPRSNLLESLFDEQLHGLYLYALILKDIRMEVSTDACHMFHTPDGDAHARCDFSECNKPFIVFSKQSPIKFVRPWKSRDRYVGKIPKRIILHSWIAGVHINIFKIIKYKYGFLICIRQIFRRTLQYRNTNPNLMFGFHVRIRMRSRRLRSFKISF